MSETAALAERRLRDHLPVVFAAVSLVAVVITFAVAIPKINASATSIRESASAIDATLISSSLEIARMENRALPAEVTSDDDGTLRFDGEPVLDGNGEQIALIPDKSVIDYEITGDGYRFCVVDKHGPWALADSSYDESITSGTDDHACTR